MTQITKELSMQKLKIRINNSDHYKAVQEWLFDHDYKWAGLGKFLRNGYEPYIFLNSYKDGFMTYSIDEKRFNEFEGVELDLHHLDPHIKPRCTVINPRYVVKVKKRAHETKKDPFESLCDQLRHLDEAIDRHENKQNKRKIERERILRKIEELVPKGYSFDKNDNKKIEKNFDRTDIEIGSVWKCERKCPALRDCTLGQTYSILRTDGVTVFFVDDVHDRVSMYRSTFLEFFQRVE